MITMESILAFASQNAESAHWLFFFLILLGGLNVPISEDVVMITAGAIASTYVPELAKYQFAWLFLACWIAAWEAYWIGRLLGPAMYRIRWFNRILTPKKIASLHYYYEKFGIFTFIVGRFIPGGVRNCLFMSSGLGKMPFITFIRRDFPACLISAGFLFYLGYLFGQNADSIIAAFKTYQTVIFLSLAFTLITAIVLKKIYQSRFQSADKRKENESTPQAKLEKEAV